MELITRPLDRWPRPFATARKNRPFHSTWETTLRKLRQELKHLESHTVVLQVAVPEEDISTATGLPRGDRNPEHPGVIVAADTKHGALKWVCDDCAKWRDNVHAIALTLERLRLADLYGVTGRGEQYAGWKMLPGPIAMGDGPQKPTMTLDEAARFVAGYGGATASRIISSRSEWEAANRKASKRLHPDMPGHDAAKWNQLGQAQTLLNNLHQRR